MRRVALALILLPACNGAVTEDMEAALGATNEALAWSLLGAEGAAWADETDPRWPRELLPGAFLRHAAAGDCPLLDREPEEGFPFALEARYTGCVSGSRLVPTTLGGTLHITGTESLVNLRFDELPIGSVRTPSGTLTGARDLGVERYELSGDLSLPETTLLDPAQAEIHLTVDHRVDSEVSFDGHVVVGSGASALRVDFDGVSLSLDDIPGECPLPFAGTVTVSTPSEVVIDLTDADVDGRVIATRRNRESTPTRLCAFASDVL